MKLFLYEIVDDIRSCVGVDKERHIEEVLKRILKRGLSKEFQHELLS